MMTLLPNPKHDPIQLLAVSTKSLLFVRICVHALIRLLLVHAYTYSFIISLSSCFSLLLYPILISSHFLPSLTLFRTVPYCMVFTYVQWSIDERISTADSEHVQRYSGIISVLTPLESTYVYVYLHSIIRTNILLLIIFCIITIYCILI